MAQVIEFSGLIDALFLAILFSALPLGASMVVGLFVSILQSATQIQEQTLTFVPKLVTIIGALFLFGGWMGAQYREYFFQVMENVTRLSLQF